MTKGNNKNTLYLFDILNRDKNFTNNYSTNHNSATEISKVYKPTV